MDRRSQIRTVFQPVVDLRTGSVKGWEALSRGPSGTHLHKPWETLAAAKDLPFGLASKLDRRCCSVALSSARGLPKDAKLFISIRPYVIYDPFLLEVFEQQGVGGDRIVLEIAERYEIENHALFVQAKRTFTDRGFELAVDNLGAGYSGLERVAHLQPQYVKLSVQLARNIDTNNVIREMMRALKTFADRVGSAMIATGIEREGELKVLREMGVQYGQGWLLGPPIDTPGSGSLGPAGEPAD